MMNDKARIIKAIVAGIIGTGAALLCRHCHGEFNTYLKSPQKILKCHKWCCEDSGKKMFLLGAFIGLAGFGVGLMLAPKSGRELREDISDTFEELKEKTKDFTEDMVDRGEEAYDGVREQVNNLAGRARRMAGHVEKDLIDSIPEKLEDLAQFFTLGVRIWNKLSERKYR